ncbi:hypothetical protein, partial [Bradyrhizobium sp.]
MARQTSPHRPHLQADTQGQQWDDADWDTAHPHDADAAHDEIAGQRVRRLLSRDDSGSAALSGRSGKARKGGLARRIGIALVALVL